MRPLLPSFRLDSAPGDSSELTLFPLSTKQPAAKPVIELTRDTRCNAIMSTFAAASTPLPTLDRKSVV